MQFRDAVKPISYALLNIASASGIVFANKAVFAYYKFNFVYALTLIHTLFTWLGMFLFKKLGFFEPKQIAVGHLGSLAGAFVAYVVLCNINLQVNSVGLYQISKIAVAPAVLALQALLWGQRASLKVTASIFVVCGGVALSTVADPQVNGAEGLAVAAGSVLFTAAYQLLAGAKQKELNAGSMQLLDRYCPLASLLLLVLTLFCHPVGWVNRTPETLLGYPYSLGSILAILLSAALGLLVNLSTFLVIGATSSLTYNVVGHIKTCIILTGGCLLFGDLMTTKKFGGICLAMVGIIWYTQIKVEEATKRAAAQSHRNEGGDLQQPLKESVVNGSAVSPTGGKAISRV